MYAVRAQCLSVFLFILATCTVFIQSVRCNQCPETLVLISFSQIWEVQYNLQSHLFVHSLLRHEGRCISSVLPIIHVAPSIKNRAKQKCFIVILSET